MIFGCFFPTIRFHGKLSTILKQMPCKYDTPYIMLSEHVRLKWKPGSETEEEINLDCTDITMERQECKSLVGWPGKCHIKENRGLPFRGVRSTVKKKDRITDLSKRVSYF